MCGYLKMFVACAWRPSQVEKCIYQQRWLYSAIIRVHANHINVDYIVQLLGYMQTTSGILRSSGNHNNKSTDPIMIQELKIQVLLQNTYSIKERHWSLVWWTILFAAFVFLLLRGERGCRFPTFSLLVPKAAVLYFPIFLAFPAKVINLVINSKYNTRRIFDVLEL